jgi:hypothetical protein
VPRFDPKQSDDNAIKIDASTILKRGLPNSGINRSDERSRINSRNNHLSISELVAKEKQLAKWHASRYEAAKNKDDPEVERLTKMINAHESLWKKHWLDRCPLGQAKELPSHKAVESQIDYLQVAVSRRIGYFLNAFERQKINPIKNEITGIQDLIKQLEKEKQSGSTVAGLAIKPERYDQSIQELKTRIKQLESEKSKYVLVQNALIRDYMGFVSYLNSARDTITGVKNLLPQNNGIKLKTIPIVDIQDGFNSLSTLFKEYQKQAEGKYMSAILAPKQKAAKDAKDQVKASDDRYSKLNLWDKFKQGDISKPAREASKKASSEYFVAEDRFNQLKSRLNKLASTIVAANIAFRKGDAISFTVDIWKADPKSRIHSNQPNTDLSVNFSDAALMKRLGLNPSLMAMGKFTRQNEGSSTGELIIHWPAFASGVTFAGGYDCKGRSKATIRRDLNHVNDSLRKAGIKPIPENIITQLADSAGIFGKRAKAYILARPSLREYKFPKEAVDILFYKYYSAEYSKARRIVDKYIGKGNFDQLPVDVRQLIVDTATRGDFGSLKNEAKREKFKNAIKKGYKFDSWSDFIKIYKDRTVFQMNPNIIRHDQREQKAREIEKRLKKEKSGK